LAVLRAETERAWLIWLRTNPHVIVVIETVHLLRFVVAHRDSRRLVPVAETKEITNGSFNSRVLFVIPVHSQDQLLEVILLRRIEIDPNVGDFAGIFSSSRVSV
jgi:hypothetical protein